MNIILTDVQTWNSLNKLFSEITQKKKNTYIITGQLYYALINCKILHLTYHIKYFVFNLNPLSRSIKKLITIPYSSTRRFVLCAMFSNIFVASRWKFIQ